MTKTLTPEAEKALSFPVGAISPLWLMFAGAAAAGAAVFWARAWLKPTNLEALTPLPAPELVETVEIVAEAVEETADVAAETVVEVVEVVAEPVVEAAPEAVEAAVETIETVEEAAPEVVETVVEAAPEVTVETVAEAVEAAADDLTKLTGIGPKLAASLAERGVTRFADIAAWTAEDVATFDKDMKLMGRIEREAWIAQARRYAEAAVH